MTEQQKREIRKRIAEKRAEANKPAPRMTEAQRARKLAAIKAKLNEKRATPVKGARMTEAEKARRIENIKRKAEKRQHIARVQTNLTEKRGSSTDVQRVAEQYKRWKESKGIKSTRMTEAEKARCIRNIKAKLAENCNGSSSRMTEAEKARRIRAIKARIAEKRSGSSKANLTRQAEATQRKIKTLLQKMKEQDMMAADPMMDPAAGMADPMAAEGGMEPQLPAEIISSIQALQGDIDALATAAGIVDPAAAEMGADGAVPAVTPEGGAIADPMAAPADPMMMEAKKARIKARIAERRNGRGNSADNLIESTKAKVEARREAMRQLRANTLNEKAYDEIGNPAQQVNDAYDACCVKPNKDVGITKGKATAKPMSGSAAQRVKQPTSAKRWAPKDLKKGKFSDGKGFDESEDRDLTEMHVDRFIERKQLNFSDLVSKGMLG